VILRIPERETPEGRKITELLIAAHIDAEGVWHQMDCPNIDSSRRLNAIGMLRLAHVAIQRGAVAP